MNVVCYDEPIALPTEESQRTSLRIQQILAHEVGAGATADPLAGSYYVEYLTNEIEKEGEEYLERIEKMGGLETEEANDFIKKEFEEAFIRNNRMIENKEQLIVGVNAFAAPGKEEASIPVHYTSEESHLREIESLKELRITRDNERVRQCIATLRERAERKDGENLMPYILEAVKAYATNGEICGTLYEAYGYPYDTMGMIESPFKQ